MAQDREQYSEFNSKNGECVSVFDSEFSSEYDSDFDNKHESDNEPKRRKISECASESESNSESESDLDSESDSEEEAEICHTDKEGYIICHPGQKLGNYEFQSIIGEGGFGRVLQVRHCINGQNAALKVIKNDKTARKSAMKEVVTLTKIAYRDPSEESLCIKMLEWFNYGGHLCIAFPLLEVSVADFLEENDFAPFSINSIRHIGHQLCTAVSFLHRNGMTHTDIKPENILFVNSSYTTVYDNEQEKAVRHPVCTDIRLIDFGNATRNFVYPVISTLYYRAPEVILGLDWSQSYDAWAVGCTLFEIYFGDLLFSAEDDREHLAMMEIVLGPIPTTMVNSTKKLIFFKDGIVNWNWNKTEEPSRNQFAPLREFQKYDGDDDNEFFDVIEKMLEYEPTKRISMREALEQTFFKKVSSLQRM